MTTWFTDSFTRADQNPPLGGWTPQGDESWAISGNALARVSGSANVILQTSTLPTSADHEHELVLVNWQTAFGVQGPGVRMADASNWYVAVMNGSNVELFKDVAGSISNIGSIAHGITGPVNVTLKCSAQGTTIKAYVNGVQKLSVTDASISATGKIGIFYGGTAIKMDDSAGYDFLVAGKAPPPYHRPLRMWAQRIG